MNYSYRKVADDSWQLVRIINEKAVDAFFLLVLLLNEKFLEEIKERDITLRSIGPNCYHILFNTEKSAADFIDEVLGPVILINKLAEKGEEE